MKREAVMKSLFVVGMSVLILFCIDISLGCSEVATSATKTIQVHTVDVDKDGDPDVTYYHDGKYISKAEADTNEDGKSDITVYAEGGKFKSAEVDTDYDGKPDQKFSDTAAFNKWLNQNNPQYKDSLGWSDWTYSPYKF
jgi:hypothetical protein